jgi:hypothetical protein
MSDETAVILDGMKADESDYALVDGLVGKTIAAVHLPGSFDVGTMVLEFTDGTRVRLDPCGYETDGIAVRVMKP